MVFYLFFILPFENTAVLFQLFSKFRHNFEKFAKVAKNTEIKNLYKNEDNMRSKMFEEQSEAKPVKPNYAVALIVISIMIMFVS